MVDLYGAMILLRRCFGFPLVLLEPSGSEVEDGWLLAASVTSGKKFSYHIHVMLYYIILYCIISNHIILYYIVLHYHFISYCIIYCITLFLYHVIFYDII